MANGVIVLVPSWDFTQLLHAYDFEEIPQAKETWLPTNSLFKCQFKTRFYKINCDFGQLWFSRLGTVTLIRDAQKLFFLNLKASKHIRCQFFHVIK